MAVRLGVIGAGYWGANLVRVANEFNVLAAVCDASPARVTELVSEYPAARINGDWRALVASDLDGVIVAAPAAQHEEIALEALARGKHVFIEKPLALSVEGGQRIVRAADAAGKIAFVGHLLLYHTGVIALLEQIRSGAIGDVVHVRSRRLSTGRLRFEENVWWSFAPHDVALMLAIFGDEPVSATGSQTGWTTPGISDFAYADFAFERGRSAHIEVGWLDPAKSARLDVFGTDGVLTFEDSRAGATLVRSPLGTRPNGRGQREIWREEPVSVPFERAEPLKNEVASFLDAMRTGAEPPTSAAASVRVLRALRLAEDHATMLDHPPLETAAR